jgi:alkylation response protein AidB-like acyl-CoA dehydrogenase
VGLSIDERDELRSTARSLLARESSAEQVRAVVGTAEGYDPGLWRKMVELGWTAIHVDEAFGGAGCGYADLGVVLRELGRALTPSPFLASAVLASGALALAEQSSVRDELLQALSGGEALGTVAFASAAGSYDSTQLTCSWSRSGGAVKLEGEAGFVLDADVASVIAVAAVDAAGSVIAVVVDRATPGIRIARMATVDATRRLFRVAFDGVVEGEDRLLTAPGPPAAALWEQVLSVGAIAAGCDAVGATQLALEHAAEYASQRLQFGKPIGTFQAVKHHCANMAIAVEASAAATRAATDALDGDPTGWANAAQTVASFVGPACAEACAQGLLVHGGIGFTWEQESHLLLKRVKLDEVLFGSPSWHRRRLADAAFPALLGT